MNITKTDFDGLLIIEPKVWGDDRGYFLESFSKENLEDRGLYYNWLQDNEAFSEKGVFRGLHYQLEPKGQTKLVRVVQGGVLDVVVDIRKESKTYGKHFSILLSSENKKQLLVPKGFAHGYIVLSDTALFLYKVDNLYCPKSERGIKYNDPALGIDWKLSTDLHITSEKDKSQPVFEEHEPYIILDNEDEGSK